MAEVAKQAGVHVTTVSLALRNHPSLPVTTRQRLQALAEQMGYRRDPALHALIAYRRQARPRKDEPVIAYITNWDTEWGWKAAAAHGEFFAGAEGKTRDLGYRLEHFWLGEPKLTHQRLSDILYTRGITGLIIASHRYEIDKALAFEWSRFSAVKIDFFPHEPKLHNVTNDQRAIIRLAMRRVTAAGYQRIGFVFPLAWDQGVDLAWSAGFLAEQQMLPPDERIPIHFIADTLASGEIPASAANHEAFARWYQHYRPEALISYTPFVLPRLEAMHVAVPEDVAFVDVLLDREPDGRIAGVRQNSRRVGELAVEILAGQLQQNTFGIPQFSTATLVEGTWFDGATLPVRTATPAVAELTPRAAE